MPEVVAGGPEFEIPTMVHGFAVDIAVGPYPQGHRRSHRRAIYATLRPTTPGLEAKLRRWGLKRGAIVGRAELDAKTARALQLDIHDPGRPTVDEQEKLVMAALRPAARLAKMVANAPE